LKYTTEKPVSEIPTSATGRLTEEISITQPVSTIPATSVQIMTAEQAITPEIMDATTVN